MPVVLRPLYSAGGPLSTMLDDSGSFGVLHDWLVCSLAPQCTLHQVRNSPELASAVLSKLMRKPVPDVFDVLDCEPSWVRSRSSRKNSEKKT